MRWKMSNKPCETLRIRRIRDTRDTQDGSLTYVQARSNQGRARLNPCLKPQYSYTSRRRNWMETEGNSTAPCGRMKSKVIRCECLWL